MDLSIITGDWPYDEKEEAGNVRRAVGADGRMKVQVRIRNGLIQWEADGRPDGRKPYGFPSMLDYCTSLVTEDPWLPVLPSEPVHKLDAELIRELSQELFDYYRRGRALRQLGDYTRAVADAGHNLRILGLMRRHSIDDSLTFNYDRYRPSLLVERGRAEMMLHLQAGDVRSALDALTVGIRAIGEFYTQYDMDGEADDCSERQTLVDLRRSLREKHNIPLNDVELLDSLQIEQEVAIRRENYEMAARLRDKITVLRQRMEHHD